MRNRPQRGESMSRKGETRRKLKAFQKVKSVKEHWRRVLLQVKCHRHLIFQNKVAHTFWPTTRRIVWRKASKIFILTTVADAMNSDWHWAVCPIHYALKIFSVPDGTYSNTPRKRFQSVCSQFMFSSQNKAILSLRYCTLVQIDFSVFLCWHWEGFR